MSQHWVRLVVAGGAYGAGVADYVAYVAESVDALAGALTALDLVALVGALAGDRYGALDPLSFGLAGGHPTGPVPLGGVLLVTGAMALPVLVALAVYDLRRETTWRPSWLHVAGALAPAAAHALAYVSLVHPDWLPLAAVPLWLDLALLVVVPVVVLGGFLLKRLVLVWPLRRRDEVLT